MDVELTPNLQSVVPSHEKRILFPRSPRAFQAVSAVVQGIFWMCVCFLYLPLIAFPFIRLFLLASSWLAEGVSFICVSSALAVLTH